MFQWSFKCFKKVSKVFNGFFGGFQVYLKEAQREFQMCFKEVSWEFQERFLGSSMEFSVLGKF